MKKKGKALKWIIALAVLALIAVAVVCIIVFVPKNIDDVKNETKAHAETMFLKNEDEIKHFSGFQTKINIYANKYASEFQCANNIIFSLNGTMEFYAREMLFAENGSAFQENYYVILDNFKKAKEYQASLDEIVKKVYEKVNASTTFTEGAWEDFREVFVEYTKSYTAAFKGLSKVYRDCGADGLVHNNMTYLVLDTINDYLDVINMTKFGDIKNMTSKLKNFVEVYVSANTTPINKYKFSQTLADKVTNIQKFSKVYEGKTKQDVIKTCGASDFSFKVSAEDKTGVLTDLKTFLEGRLSA